MITTLNLLIKMNKKNGFSIAEVVVAILLVGVLTVATMPMMTQFMPANLNLDKNANDCIISGASNVTYNAATGVVTQPPVNTACSNAIFDCKNGRGKACDTLTWNATHGTAAQVTAAETVLRAACDQGAEKACDYFISKCTKNGTVATPFCNVAGAFKDITYYLSQPATTTNSGSFYIGNTLNNYLLSGNAVLKAELYNDCNINSSLVACSYIDEAVLVNDCTGGNNSACSIAYDKGYNRTCAQIKANWSASIDGTYKITPFGRTLTPMPAFVFESFNLTPPTYTWTTTAPLSAYCDMSKDEGGWTLLGKNGALWSDANLDAITSTTVTTSSNGVILPVTTLNAIVSNSPSKLFRFDNTSNSIKMYIQDSIPLWESRNAHFWKSTGTTKCSLNYTNYIANSMTDASIHEFAWYPLVGTWFYGDHGFILWHQGDAFNYDGRHPCSLGTGYFPSGQSLKDLWIK